MKLASKAGSCWSLLCHTSSRSGFWFRFIVSGFCFGFWFYFTKEGRFGFVFDTVKGC